MLTSRCGEAPFEPGVMRELEYVGHGKRAALRAPLAAVCASRVTRGAGRSGRSGANR